MIPKMLYVSVRTCTYFKRYRVTDPDGSAGRPRTDRSLRFKDVKEIKGGHCYSVYGPCNPNTNIG